MTKLIGTAPNQVPVNGMLGELAFLDRASLQKKSPPVGGIAHLMAATDTITIDGMLFLRSGLAVHVSDVPDWPAWATKPDASYKSVTSGLTGNSHFVAHNGAGVWMAGGSGARRSIDNGATWADFNPGSAYTIRDMAYGNGVFIAVGSSGTVRRSTDAGVTWTQCSAGFSTGYSVMAIATDGAGTWIAISEYGEMRRSTDNGLNWSTPNHGLPYGYSLLDVAYGNGVWILSGQSGGMRRSTDGGATWSAIATGAAGMRALATDGAGVWVALGVGGAGGSLRSTDGGATWSGLNIPFAGLITCVSYDGHGSWIAGSYNEGLRRSTDGGVTWPVVATGFGAQQITAISSYVGIVTIAVSYGSAMQRSRNAIGIEVYSPNQYLRIA